MCLNVIGGGWIKKNVIPDDKGRYGYFDSLYQDNQVIDASVIFTEICI